MGERMTDEGYIAWAKNKFLVNHKVHQFPMQCTKCTIQNLIARLEKKIKPSGDAPNPTPVPGDDVFDKSL